MLKNYVFILIARGLRIGVGLLLLFGVARYLSVGEFGDFLFVVNLAASVMSIAFYGIGQAVVRDVSADITLAPQYVGAAFKLRSHLTLVSVVVLIAVCIFMDIRGQILLALVIAATSEVFRSFSDLAKEVYRSFERMRYDTLVTTLYSAIVMTLVTVAIFFDATMVFIVAAICLANLVQFFVSVRVMLKHFVVPDATVEPRIMKGFIKDAFSLGVGALCAQLIWRAPTLVLKRMRSGVDVALFEAAHGLILQTLILNEVFITVLLPRLSALISTQDHARIRQIGARLLKTLMLLFINVYLVFFVFHSGIIGLLYGQKYVASGFVLMVLSPSLIFISLTGVCHIFLISMKLQRQFILCNAIATGVLLLSLPLAVHRYGYEGAAFASLFTYAVNFVVSLYMTNRHVFKVPLRQMLRALGLSVVIAFVSAAVRDFNQAAAFFVLEASFLLMATNAGILDADEKLYLKTIALQLIKPKKKKERGASAS
ncbi:polysaccharide biosynthesis protein [Candidatus Magnetobacterium bavaricum]|uniref:Polysaccharide biosynthesis protein n=1 Tax=Candidatus Magnetobacterium bavaricum TaxID=29290 RepID=A0A0F3GSP0_9BACT|nr:polysaccharide biosynthesis protein [Candidatus Magnetobacterium bavaricum]